jgi:soluble lytic murein transglycosylase-like protein
MRSIFRPRPSWIEQGRNKVHVQRYCGNRLSRRSTLLLIALLLVFLETGLLSSNAIGFFRMTYASPNIAPRQTSVTPSVSRPDPAVTAIEGLLKKFEIDSTRRKRVTEALVHSSRRHDLDPRLVASIMIVESRGNPFAISPSNAVGIMQIHVPTWARTIEEEGINLFKIEDNIDFGVRILGGYVQRYGLDEGIKRYNGWNPDSPESVNAEAYLQKVRHIYYATQD